MLIWMSFADPHKPRGQTFLGVAIVEVEDQGNPKENLGLAIEKAWRLGINPGGQIQSIAVPPEMIPDDCRNRLLSKNELIERNLGVSTRI